MNKIDSRNIYTDRLELRVPTMEEQYRLWNILIDENINQFYFPTPDRIFNKFNLSKDNIDDLKSARKIFMEQLSDWERQLPFYEKKIECIKNQEDSQKFTWSIFLKDTDNVIGQITCQPKDEFPENIRDVGWYIDPEFQGKGYGTEAAIAVLDFMYNEVEITDIFTSAADINIGSWRIMEKLGFEYIGDDKSTYYKDDKILICKKYHSNKELFLNKFNNPLHITLDVDKDVFINKITDDKVINITGESGSGKSFYTNKYINNYDYIVIDTDLVFSDKDTDNIECLKLREIFKDESKDILINDFDRCYITILEALKDTDKTIVIDSAQYRNIKDYSILKGEVIVLRTCINTCYERVLKRFKDTHKNYSEDEFKSFAERKKGMFKWYKAINVFLDNVNKL